MKQSFDCTVHGEVQVRVIPSPSGGTAIKGMCPKCQEAREGDEQRAKERTRKAYLDTAIKNAGFGERFWGKTLDNYETTTKEQEEAVEKCRWFLEHIKVSAGLIIVGGLGVGKNHLAAGISREVIKTNKRAIKTSVGDLDSIFKEGWGITNEEGQLIKKSKAVILESFVAPAVLTIDEIGFQRGTKDELLHIGEVCSKRYDAMKPTILLTNVQPKDIAPLIGQRAYDRFKEGGKIIALNGESYRATAGNELLKNDFRH